MSNEQYQVYMTKTRAALLEKINKLKKAKENGVKR